MKVLKFPIIIATILALSIQALKLYDDIWMIFSYFLHMCILFLIFCIYCATSEKASLYRLGAYRSIIIILMILSTYPFLFGSENFISFISQHGISHFNVYEGGILVTLLVIISELFLIIWMFDCIIKINESKRAKINIKSNMLLGSLLPFFLLLGYFYIDNTIENINKTKEEIKETKKIEELIRISKIEQAKNDSINNELAQKHVDLSFGRYKLGTSKHIDNGKPHVYHLLDEDIRYVTTEEYNGLIYKIIVRFEPMAVSSLFIEKAAEFYTKKYGETGTFAKWKFKNGSIEIKVAGTETKKILDVSWLPTYTIYEDVEYDVVNIVYTDHKLDSIVRQEEALKEELRKKEEEERLKKEEKEKELKKIEIEKEKRLEYEMI